MPFHSFQPLFFKITAFNVAKVETIRKVLIKKKTVNKFYLTDCACEGLGVHSLYVKEKLGRFADTMKSTFETSE